jgi:hypothetical protein
MGIFPYQEEGQSENTRECRTDIDALYRSSMTYNGQEDLKEEKLGVIYGGWLWMKL